MFGLTQPWMRRWLRLGAGMTIGAGLVCLGGVHPATETPWVLAMDAVQWPVDGSPGSFAFATRASSAMLGGVMIGWGSTLALVPYRAGSRVPLLVGLVAWFLTDTLGSVVCGFYGNVIVNCLFLAVLAPPILGIPAVDAPDAG